MGSAEERIRVSEAVKREIERRRCEGDSYDDVLERLLAEDGGGDFDAGFGRWSDAEADRVREGRRTGSTR
jgi:hypothetical protein